MVERFQIYQYYFLIQKIVSKEYGKNIFSNAYEFIHYSVNMTIV